MSFLGYLEFLRVLCIDIASCDKDVLQGFVFFSEGDNERYGRHASNDYHHDSTGDVNCFSILLSYKDQEILEEHDFAAF